MLNKQRPTQTLTKLMPTQKEFEKLISFSGTPTVVWRRTCEVVVVGAEFSMLTQWSKEYLMGRYIYEVRDGDVLLQSKPSRYSTLLSIFHLVF